MSATAPLRRRRHRRRTQRPRLRRVSRARGLAVCVLERRGVSWAAPPSPRNSIRAFAIRPRATRSACSIRRSSATSSSREHGLRIVERPISNFLPLPDGRHLHRRRRTRGDAGRSREVLAPRRRRACPRTTRCSIASPTCLRDLLLATPPNVGGGAATRCSTRGRSRSASARSISPDSATCSTSSPRARATCSTAGSSRIRSRRHSASTRSSATSRARTRRARRTCCCTTSSARSTASAASGATRIGGMGAITQAMAKECAARGVVMRTGAPVARVIVKAGARSASSSTSGEVIEAKRVVANVTPKRAVRAAGRAGARAGRFPRAHRRLPLRLGHVPDERRALRAARLHRAAGQGRAAASRQRHHHRAVARLHGARLLRCEDARLVATSRSSRC